MKSRGMQLKKCAVKTGSKLWSRLQKRYQRLRSATVAATLETIQKNHNPVELAPSAPNNDANIHRITPGFI
jgi:hypothetical protein